MSFLQFIKENLTINLLISVIVYSLFSCIHEKILIPILDILLLDKFELKDQDIEIGQKKIKYGFITKQIISSIILLSLIYVFKKF